MKCVFCNDPLTISYCENKVCRPYHVAYIFGIHRNNPEEQLNQSNLAKIQFKVRLHNNKDYEINYHVATKDLEIIEQISHYISFDEDSSSTAYTYKNVLITKYDSLTITPTNVQDKLPTILLFS